MGAAVPHRPIVLCNSAYSERSSRGGNLSWKEEPSDEVCEIADAPAGFQSGVCGNIFGFRVSRNEKGGKVAERQQNNTQTLPGCN